MLDPVSITKLQSVYPGLADKIVVLASTLESQGILIRVVQGLRTWIQQDVLYAQGRTTRGSIITNVQGGYSFHCFGLAVDCAPSQFGPGQPYSPDWNASHPVWRLMETKGRDLGLVSGAFWRTFVDAPHFQMNGHWPESEPTDEVRHLFMTGGYPAVWAALDRENL
jgi:peptidoglycan L-alanyl-D-glutamate endopeptidase CwlK